MRAVAALVLCLAASAAAEPVLVVSSDDAFRAALADVLVPGDFTIVRVEAEVPPVDELAKSSRDLADREHATAVVWLIASADGTTLVAYDRDVDRLLVRPLAVQGALGPQHGAEAARMARTMLRALRVTPETDLPPPRAVEAPAVRSAAARVKVPVVLAPVESQLAIAAAIGLRSSASSSAGDAAALDATGLAIWRPAGWGAALAGTYSPRGDVMTPLFAGVAGDVSGAALVRYPIPLGPDRLRLAALAGPALHVVTVRGTLADGQHVDVRRYDGAARALATIGYALDPVVDVGVMVSAEYLVQNQQLQLDDREVLATRRLQISVAVALTLRLL